MAIGRLSSGGVRFDVRALLFRPLDLDVLRFAQRSLKGKFFLTENQSSQGSALSLRF